ncbi:MAG: phenylacetate-CoA oxygenase subunit PaaC [Crocinitomicaceae bacterium]|nr:phenylacetate-CoA oxygenase subunit PaaC [Crocinitomicaceae bacterium]
MNNSIFRYTLRLADNLLILGQRLGEWCGHGPALEEDIALTNIALDYIGQATYLYKYAAEKEGAGRDEDQLAFLRDAGEYGNHLIAELPNNDYAFTISRQYLFSAWYRLFLLELSESHDQFLRGFAEKSLKETTYHLQHSGDWIVRMGDGTEESHTRIQNAIDKIWSYTGELFVPDALDVLAVEQGFGVDVKSLKEKWLSDISEKISEATLRLPQDQWMHGGGKAGIHTEHLGFILADMQFLQRAYPDAKW